MKKIIIIIISLLILGAGYILFFTQLGEITRLNSREVTIFEVRDEVLTMTGLINSKSFNQIKKVFEENPQITIIDMVFVPGSIDDETNIAMAKWLSEKDITTKIGRYGEIASGGTDLFLAGSNRIVEEGAQIGVHSWADSLDNIAADYEVGHDYHQPYIDYYKEVGFSEQEAKDFYYFTINAAPATDIHYMTEDEIIKYMVATEEIIEPMFIFEELEKERDLNGLSTISEEEAEQRGFSYMQ